MVVLTHYHEDHTGGAAWIQQNKGVPLYINEMSLQECMVMTDYPRFRKEFWGVRESFEAKPLKQTISSENYEWDVIPTSGHSEDHNVLLNRETGLLFSGDLFISKKIFGMLREESVVKTIASLKKIVQEDFDKLFCCHAGYIADGKKALNGKLEYLQQLAGEILFFYEKGYSVDEINGTLFKKEPRLVSLSDYEWGSKHIVKSVIKEKELLD